VAAVAEGLGLRAVARVFVVDPNMVLTWVLQAADHAMDFSRAFLHGVEVMQVQRGELFAVMSAGTAGEIREAEASQRLSHSPQ
jgi:hypothetical protein